MIPHPKLPVYCVYRDFKSLHSGRYTAFCLTDDSIIVAKLTETQMFVLFPELLV